MFYELTIGIVSVAFSFLTFFSFHDFFHRIFYRNNRIKYDERHDLNGKELLYVSVVRMDSYASFLLLLLLLWNMYLVCPITKTEQYLCSKIQRNRIWLKLIIESTVCSTYCVMWICKFRHRLQFEWSFILNLWTREAKTQSKEKTLYVSLAIFKVNH